MPLPPPTPPPPAYASSPRYICPTRAYSEFPPHLNKKVRTLTGVDSGCLLGHLLLINLSGCLNGKLILDFFARLNYLVLFLVFLGKAESSRPRQLFDVFDAIVLAAQHRSVGGGVANADLLPSVNQIETSNYFLITL